MGSAFVEDGDSNMAAADKRDTSLHVRVSDESDAVLELMKASTGKSKAEIAAELVEEALHGKGHALRVAALRFARSGLGGRAGE